MAGGAADDPPKAEPAGHCDGLNGLVLHATQPLPILVPAVTEAGPPNVLVEPAPTQTPMAAGVVLRPDASVTDPVLTPMPWPESAATLHDLIHWPAVPGAKDSGRPGLARPATVARHVPVAMLRRPVDLCRLDGLAAHIVRISEAPSAGSATPPVRKGMG